jgi:hypothetical protein
MDWVEFLQRVFNKSDVTVAAEHPVIFLGGERNLGNIITLIESTDPRVLGKYRRQANCMKMVETSPM